MKTAGLKLRSEVALENGKTGSFRRRLVSGQG